MSEFRVWIAMLWVLVLILGVAIGVVAITVTPVIAIVYVGWVWLVGDMVIGTREILA